MLSTNAGQNWQAIFQLAMGAIIAMPEGLSKTILLITCLGCMSAVSFATKGSGITPEKGQELLDTAKELKEVLGEGRKE
ncbi:MAG: hypothetical protein RLZ25_1575 [Pseudomonadota bacterium]|jgi:hypothetical protein